MKIDVHICTRDRATELAMLLVSLSEQTYYEFDVYVLDDASGTPVQNFYFIQTLAQRLKLAGHNIIFIRNSVSKGVAYARQQLVDYGLKHSTAAGFCRIDDDTVLATDYLSRLVDVIKAGYHIASGITPPIANPYMPRCMTYVTPIINEIVLSEDGRFLLNMDDCAYYYQEEKILPAHHFRSNALILREVHEKVSYEDWMRGHGFREEAFFSFRALMAGYNIGVDTGAYAYHFICPSGGERSHAQAHQDSLQNQRILNRLVRRWHKETRFLDKYHERLGITPAPYQRNLFKENNLIYTTEE